MGAQHPAQLCRKQKREGPCERNMAESVAEGKDRLRNTQATAYNHQEIPGYLQRKTEGTMCRAGSGQDRQNSTESIPSQYQQSRQQQVRVRPDTDSQTCLASMPKI